jgi:phosphatidylglycerol lysyltransferase
MFPLDFVGLSRSATLLLGFGLILVSLHLWSYKRRAMQLAIVFAALSAGFHLSKGWDVEEAICSFATAVLLIVLSNIFRVKSAAPSLNHALKRAILALGLAGLYGAVGFWLVDRQEFGHNFHWWDAALRTFQVMLMTGDFPFSPRTPYAQWFLDSLYLMSAAAFVYCGFALFRPVVYRFRHDEEDREKAAEIAKGFGRSGQDFFKHSEDKSFFFSETGRTFLSYRVARGFALVLGDPVGPDDELDWIVEEFVDYCREHGWRVAFHQVQADRLALYERLGFRRLKIGDDAVVDLAQFSLQGSAMKEFRNTVNRLDRLGYRVVKHDPPIEKDLLDELQSVSDQWLSQPGHRERRFTLGRFDRQYVSSTPVYVAVDPEGRAAAFLNLIPSYQPGLATVDLMRRRSEAINGIMDYLFAKVFLDLKEHGFRRFSLGMAPVAEFQPGEHITLEERAVQWAMKRFPALFRADSLRRFKSKYAHTWEPRYDVYRHRFDLPRLALALRDIAEITEEAA